MDWDKLRIFHSVADVGSLTHAGDHLHLSQSAVSRQIRALEESLDCTLFHRHARGLILTEQGELLFAATKSMTSSLEAAEARIKDSEEEVYGQLRVTTPTGFGSLWLAPRLDKLYAKYPELNIDLMLEERVLDLPMREADVAIRMKEPSQADLIRKRIINIRMCIYATQEYLDQHGTPYTLEDMGKHRLISQNPDTPQVSAGARLTAKMAEYDEPSKLYVNNYFGVLQAIKHNLGIGILPDYLGEFADGLVQVLPDHQSEEVPVYLAYPQELRHSKRIAVFKNFIMNEISDYKKNLF